MSFSPAQLRLDGRRALVTGGATGIGAAIARGLAASGADVAVSYRSHAPESVLTSIRESGRKGAALKSDFAKLDAEAANALVAEAEAAIGPLDILVCNAGIIRRAPAEEFAQDDWRGVLQVNLDAAWYLSQAAARSMLPRGHGRVINIASVLSFQGGILVPAYTAAKHALLGLTRALCNEWAGRGITVNAIAPGYTATENTAALRADPERSAALLSRIPAGRWAEPDDMAGAAVFLASDAASYVNGHALVVDGGWLAR